MASSEAARPELEQPDTKCPRCNSDWACQQCSDCPNGAYCSRGAWTGSGECLCYWYIDKNYYEYDSNMDYFNSDFQDCIYYVN